MKGREFLLKMKMENVTQYDIAEKCKVSHQAVQKWSAKKDEQVAVPPKHWINVANLLRISVNDLAPGVSMSGNVTADNNSVAQQSGRDATVTKGHPVTLSPVKSQLIYLIERVATEDYCKRQIAILQEAERVLSGK